MNAMQLQGMSRDELAYALSKQIPSMTRGFTIQTDYGDIAIGADDAARFVTVLQHKLERRLRQEERRGAR